MTHPPHLAAEDEDGCQNGLLQNISRTSIHEFLQASFSPHTCAIGQSRISYRRLSSYGKALDQKLGRSRPICSSRSAYPLTLTHPIRPSKACCIQLHRDPKVQNRERRDHDRTGENNAATTRRLSPLAFHHYPTQARDVSPSLESGRLTPVVPASCPSMFSTLSSNPRPRVFRPLTHRL